MADLTREVFALMCATTVNAINSYKSRKKIIVSPNNLIDTENSINKEFIKSRKKFIERRQNQVKTQKSNKTKILTPEQIKSNEKIEKESQIRVDWDKRKVIADTLKAESDHKLKELQLEKMLGKLLPFELMENIFKINIQSIFINFESELETLASIYCDTFAAGDRSKLSEIMTKLREFLSRIIKTAQKNAEKEIESAINEYSETRNRGERK